MLSKSVSQDVDVERHVVEYNLLMFAKRITKCKTYCVLTLLEVLEVECTWARVCGEMFVVRGVDKIWEKGEVFVARVSEKTALSCEPTYLTYLYLRYLLPWSESASEGAGADRG
jgi:hypothetical protein